VIYRSPDGGHGGILYAEANAQGYDLIWHWYFDDDVPLSIEPVEVNGDGLWDARLKMKDGKSVDYIQDQTFTLAAGPRDDRIALNGESSAPVAARFPLWQCFDGDSTTTWTSSARAYVDLPAPLGIESGVLMVRTADVDRPKKCKVVADGKTVREFELENRAGLQTVDLGEQVRKARKVRFEIDSSYGSGDVAIAELELK
jgi:hypothetical protein